MQLEIHPICKLFPEMSKDDLQALKDDIQENGQRVELLVYDGKIYDGRNRYTVLCELEKEPMVKVVDKEPTVREILALNLHRRHLTASQRAAIAAELLPKIRVESEKQNGAKAPFAKLQKGCTDNVIPFRAGQEAARIVGGTSERHVNSAAFVKANNKELFEQVKAGEVSIGWAEKKIKGETPQYKSKSPKEDKRKYEGTDFAGHQVPKKIEEVFKAAYKLMNFYDDMRKLGRQIASQCRLAGGEVLAAKRELVYTDKDENGAIVRVTCTPCNEVADMIELGSPYSVCSYCRGASFWDDKVLCAACDNRGWLTKLEWENADHKENLE